MPIVKVWNDNEYDHTENFKGNKITVPAKEFIEMEYEEAMDFMGQFTGIAPEKEDGSPDEKFFKKIRVEQPKPEEVYRDDGLTNHLTGKKAGSLEELQAMAAMFAHLQPKAPEKAADDSAKGIIAELQAQVERLTAMVEGKKKPGRPRKEA